MGTTGANALVPLDSLYVYRFVLADRFRWHLAATGTSFIVISCTAAQSCLLGGTAFRNESSCDR
jgi:hypothetical protein